LAGVSFSFFLFYWSLLELYVVYQPRFNKIGVLLGFIAVLHGVLPLVMAGIMAVEQLTFHSPVGVIGLLFDVQKDSAEANLAYVVAANLVLSAIPLGLVFKRYQHLLAVRDQMTARTGASKDTPAGR
jgi:hypothetical protein